MTKKRIAVFASGSGSNAQRIFEHFQHHNQIEVSLLLCNKPNAVVLQRAEKFGIPAVLFSREDFYQSDLVLERLEKDSIDFIVLAGFMWLVPENLVSAYPSHIVNIHPSLLPKYGGKGMYGINVHKAVKEAGETYSGITIHLVNQKYDEGDIIAQFSCMLNRGDSPEQIAEKVQVLEHENYPKVIENLVLNKH